MGQDDVGRQRDQFRRVSANVVGFASGPARVDAHVAPDDPARLREPLLERPDPGLKVRIVRDGVQEHADAPHPLALLRPCPERPRCRRAAEQYDELAPLHVDFALPLIASSPSVRHPASLIFTRATSIILPPETMRSACADASPARTSPTSSSAVNPFANISASVQPSGDAASSSRARRRSGLGPWRRRWGWAMVWWRWWLGTWLVRLGYHAECGSPRLA